MLFLCIRLFTFFNIIVCCSSLTVVSAKVDVTILADDNYPPYSFRKNGQAAGIYAQILQRIFANMPDFNVTIQPISWKRGLALVEQGAAFAIYPPYKHTLIRPYMDYDAPILDESLVVFCRQELLSSARPKWPQDYYGLTFGNNSGFAAGGDQFWQAVQAKKITINETQGAANNLRKLISGRIDCYLNDLLSIQWELKILQSNGEYDGKTVKLGTIISQEQGYLGFAVNAHRYAFKSAFKTQYLNLLNTMHQRGEIQKIIDEYVQ